MVASLAWAVCKPHQLLDFVPRRCIFKGRVKLMSIKNTVIVVIGDRVMHLCSVLTTDILSFILQSTLSPFGSLL